MSALRLIWVGRPRAGTPESNLADRYLERINRFVSMDQRTLKPATGSLAQEVHVQRESQRILEVLDEKDYVVALDERGKELTSMELARLLTRLLTSGRRVSWIVGGALGLSPELRRRADFVLSLSKMTLPHALARALLLEQIYRALCIRANHPYHHEG